MDNVQIEIQDSDNSILGVLEVGSVKNFPLSLTTSISDLRDITTRSGSFSTSFKVPSTKDNDDLLNHIYLAEQKNYKDFDAEKDCVIRVNGLDIERGKLQITKINALGRADQVSYSFKFFGNNMDWVLKMKGYKTKDLPYLNQSLTFNATNTQLSWANYGGLDAPVYAWINRGARVSPATVKVEDFRPDYFVLDYLNSAFDLVGYNFESSFFNDSTKLRLMIPFFGKNWKILQTTIDNNLVDVSLSAKTTQIDLSVPNLASQMVFNIDMPLIDTCSAVGIVAPNTFYTSTTSSTTGAYTENSDAGNNFASGVFTAPVDGFYVVDGQYEYSYHYDATTPEEISGNLSRTVQHYALVNGTTRHGFNPTMTQEIAIAPSTPKERRFVELSTSNSIYMLAGDTLKVYSGYWLFNTGAATTANLTAKLEHHLSTQYTVTLQPNMLRGETFNWADKSDDVVEVFDIVMDIFKVFNCYVRTNQGTRTVYAEPRDDFYNALSTADNWTDKIDDNIQTTLEYNSKTYNENHVYDYANDSEDKYLNARNKIADNNWLSHEHVFPAKFKDGTTNYKTKVIAATYTLEDTAMTDGSTGSNSVTRGGYTARLWNEEKDKTAEHTDDFAPRLLYFKYGEQKDSILPRSHVLSYESILWTSFPYALPFPLYKFNGAYADVAGNLSFKDVEIPNAPSTHDAGLWQTHFSKTSQEIENGKRARVNFLFDLADWVAFDFRKPIYIDNRYPELEGYWRVERINGYQPTSNAISVPFDLVQARTYPTLATTEQEEPQDEGSGLYRTIPAGGGIDSTNTSNSIMASQDFGYNNYLTNNNNAIYGNNSFANGQNQLVYGAYNVDASSDVSTDLLHFGVGIEGNPRTLIKVDQYGNVFFNGSELPLEGGSGSVVDISTDTTAVNVVDTYLVDTSAGDVTLTLPVDSTVRIGKVWNCKKVSASNSLIIVGDDDGTGTNTEIDDDTSGATINGLNDNLPIQWTGTEFKIL